MVSIASSWMGRLSVYIVLAEYNSSYLATSHVWFGGLGNLLANEPSSCQLRMLLRLQSKVCKRELVPQAQSYRVVLDHQIGDNWQSLSEVYGFRFYQWLFEKNGLPLAWSWLLLLGASSQRKKYLFWIDT